MRLGNVILNSTINDCWVVAVPIVKTPVKNRSTVNTRFQLQVGSLTLVTTVAATGGTVYVPPVAREYSRSLYITATKSSRQPAGTFFVTDKPARLLHPITSCQRCNTSMIQAFYQALQTNVFLGTCI
jgi:hypothetical protein